MYQKQVKQHNIIHSINTMQSSNQISLKSNKHNLNHRVITLWARGFRKQDGELFSPEASSS